MTLSTKPWAEIHDDAGLVDHDTQPGAEYEALAHRVIESDDCNTVREITVALGETGGDAGALVGSRAGASPGAEDCNLRLAGRFSLQFLDGSFSLRGGEFLSKALRRFSEANVAIPLFGTA